MCIRDRYNTERREGRVQVTEGRDRSGNSAVSGRPKRTGIGVGPFNSGQYYDAGTEEGQEGAFPKTERRRPVSDRSNKRLFDKDVYKRQGASSEGALIITFFAPESM